MTDAPVLVCCKPFRRAFPSGVAWAHSNWCKVAPKQKVLGIANRAKQQRRLDREHAMETARLGVMTREPPRQLRADEPHSACVLAYVDEGSPCDRCAPLVHPDGCRCQPCQRYEWEANGW